MSRPIRIFLFLVGLWIFFAWGFRLYILIIRWGSNPSWIAPLVFAILFFLMGGFFVFMGTLGKRATQRHYVTLMIASLLILGFWGIRLARQVLALTVDPNPRSHVHLSVTFLVVGMILFLIGWKGRKKTNADD